MTLCLRSSTELTIDENCYTLFSPAASGGTLTSASVEMAYAKFADIWFTCSWALMLVLRQEVGNVSLKSPDNKSVTTVIRA